MRNTVFQNTDFCSSCEVDLKKDIQFSQPSNRWEKQKRGVPPFTSNPSSSSNSPIRTIFKNKKSRDYKKTDCTSSGSTVFESIDRPKKRGQLKYTYKIYPKQYRGTNLQNWTEEGKDFLQLFYERKIRIKCIFQNLGGDLLFFNKKSRKDILSKSTGGAMPQYRLQIGSLNAI